MDSLLLPMQNPELEEPDRTELPSTDRRPADADASANGDPTPMDSLLMPTRRPELKDIDRTEDPARDCA